MKRSHLLVLSILMALLVTACLPPSTPVQPTSTPSKPVEKALWQQDWEKTLAAAKNEGNIVVLTSFGGEGRDAIARAFKEKYGLGMEFVVGRSGEIATKVTAERRAGLYLEDTYLAGSSSLMEFRDADYLESLKPLLLLPEVLDPKVWLDGEPRFIDKEGLMLSHLVEAISGTLINTDLVKPDEIKSYRDLLNPKWKGKIVVMDPSMGSAGTAFFFLLWELMGPDFTRELAKQDLAITRDGRLQVEWIARGRYAISGTPSADIRNEFLKAGAPIKIIQPVEGTLSSSSKGVVALLKKAPHPNAAKVFVNWLLTKEGQTVLSQVSGQSSRRLDVSREGLDPATFILPGVKYVLDDTEEAVRKKMELQEVSREVWNIGK